jgi:hypothetical protein
MKKHKIIEIDRTLRTVTIEVIKSELDENGFDSVWDEIRYVYGNERYKLKKIIEKNNRLIIKFQKINQK